MPHLTDANNLSNLMLINLYDVVMCVFMSVRVDVNLSRGSKITGFKNALKSYHAVGNYKEIVLILVYVGFFFMLPFSCYVAKRPSQQRGRTSYNRLVRNYEKRTRHNWRGDYFKCDKPQYYFYFDKKNLIDFFTFYS